MSCYLPNLQSSDLEHQAADAELVRLCRRLIALDAAVQKHDRCDTDPDNEEFRRIDAEWWALLGQIAPIRAATDTGRTAKLHAALVATRYSADGFSETADGLVKAALTEFVAAHPLAAAPLRPDEAEALERCDATIDATI